ncbi:S8 family serine peptidase [Alkalihalobacillus oceani]|uniref:S8 family peptidase n=1 Tax=Halalkalibacter oceani TaxID=1653776 RepID=UPI00203D0491|nr:S8 family serine peptidase [Halalkalibacter oceani]MCM3760149.1 S8 family serine peptidase [Halalkalibacter oceani]
MTNRIWLRAVLVLLLTALVAYPAAAEESHRYIVGFTEQIDHELIDDVAIEVHQYLEDIEAVALDMTPAAAEQLRASGQIAYVEKDETFTVSSQIVDWGVEVIGAPAVWANGLTGKGVKIAILDSGVHADHEDLRITKGKSFVSYTDSFADDNGHGTHVAGIIAARNNNRGIVGVAHEASIYVGKVLDENGDGYTSDVVKAIQWALEEEVDIINVSMGGRSASTALKNALDQAYEAGALIIAAAGNKGNADGTGNTVDYPAAYDSVIAVAAVDHQDHRASFSATGDEVEVSAPGVGIRSTYTDGGYVEVNGTSMAAPHVAGHLALLKQAYPEATNDKLRGMLHKQTVDLGEPGRDRLYGYGRIELPPTLRAKTGRPLPPENLQVVQLDWEENERFQLEITWGGASSGVEATKFHIYRNGELLDKVSATTNRYVDEVEEGSYTYAITAVSKDRKESEKSLDVTISVRNQDEETDMPSFTDVQDDEWYAEAIYELVNQEIIQGYPDDTFRPSQTITRGEAAVMMTRALQLETSPYVGEFLDVRRQSYAADYIQTMVDQEIFQGYSDGSFRPHTAIPRGEVAVILNRSFEFAPDSRVIFPDVPPRYFAAEDIAVVAGADVAFGRPDGNFQPRTAVTRAEFAVFLSRALHYGDDEAGEETEEAEEEDAA